MITQPSLRVFLASPGGLETEREVVRAAVEEHNARHAGASGPTFEVVGWEKLRGTAQRPQTPINELLAEAHFLVALFGKKWGSSPGSPWGFTSGTEEELFGALTHLAVPDRPMRDVWVGFMDEPAPEGKVAALKGQIRETNALFYEELSDREDLKAKVFERLTGWSESFGAKQARHVVLKTSTGREMLRATELRLRGKALIQLGSAEEGREQLRRAAEIGGPEEDLSYAMALTKRNEFSPAQDHISKAIQYVVDGQIPRTSPLVADIFAAQAVLLRTQGKDVDARGRLEAALPLVPKGDLGAYVVRGRIQDNLGIICQKLGEHEIAREYFEEALGERLGAGDSINVAYSYTNLGRLLMRQGLLNDAERMANQAISILRTMPPSALKATSQLLAGQIALKLRKYESAISYVQASLALNRQMQNSRGEAMCEGILAKTYLEWGDVTSSREHAEIAQALNVEMGSEDQAPRIREILRKIEDLDAPMG